MFEHLEYSGYNGRAISCTLYSNNETKDLAIILPGRGYTSHMPLLYYSADMLSNMSKNVLTVNHNYSLDPIYSEGDVETRERILRRDIQSLHSTISERLELVPKYLVVKSLGTKSALILLEIHEEYLDCKYIWMTPVINKYTVDEIMKYKPESMFIIGTADPFYNKLDLEELVKATNGKLLEIDDANHSMQVPSGTIDSLEILLRIVREMQDFLREK